MQHQKANISDHCLTCNKWTQLGRDVCRGYV